MEFRARFLGTLGAAALPQSENHIGQQQCVAFILRHTIFRKRGFSQINVTPRRRSTSSTGASREPQTLSRELRAMGYRKLISKCGDGRLRTLLYEAANVMLTRYRGSLALKNWALGIARRSTMR